MYNTNPSRSAWFPVVVGLGTIVLVVAMFVSANLRCYDCGRSPRSWERDGLGLRRAAEAVQIFALRKKRLPTAEEGLGVAIAEYPVLKDQWGRSYLYVATDPGSGRFDIVTYAADGEPGGTGDNEDIHLSDIDPDLTTAPVQR